jgi:hypothetical protein
VKRLREAGLSDGRQRRAPLPRLGHGGEASAVHPGDELAQAIERDNCLSWVDDIALFSLLIESRGDTNLCSWC